MASPFFFITNDFGVENSGMSTFLSGGSVACQKYSISQDLRQLDVPTAGVGPEVGVRDFIAMLKSQAGITWINAHGGSTLVLVEVYPGNDDGENAAKTQRNTFTDLSPDTTAEFPVFGTPEGYWAIAVRSAVIQREMGKQGIVMSASCDSFALRSAFVGGTIDRARAFVGMGGLCLLSPSDQARAVTRDIFDNMAAVADGTTLIGGIAQRTNRTLANSFVVADTNNKIRFPDNPIEMIGAPSGGSGIRLFVAPRLVFSEVREFSSETDSFSRTVFRSQYGSEYPYNPGDPPGSAGIVNKSFGADYAFTPFGALGDAQRLSLSVRF